MKAIVKLAIVVNANKPGAAELGLQLQARARALGVETLISDEFPIPVGLLEGCQLCCVIGGDGTILGVVNEAVRRNVPVMGVNLGTLGFMANFAAGELLASFKEVLAGGFRVLPRSLLQVRCADGSEKLALNDVVIKSTDAHLARLEVHSDGKFINTFAADGLIVSTPTGSTAYNLSAGGPIVHPETHVMVLTPVNPHTLSNRSLVLDGKRTLHIKVPDDTTSRVGIAADGVSIFPSGVSFPIRISMLSDCNFQLVHPREYSHFQILRTKLHWTGGKV